jgi:hypothetical protein
MKLLKLLSLGCLFLVTSCNDDPELVKKRQEQKNEIARLEGENMLLNEQLSSLPPDRSEELKEIKIKVEQQTKDLELLEQEIVQLETKKRGLEAELEQYKKNYPISQ